MSVNRNSVGYIYDPFYFMKNNNEKENKNKYIFNIY